METVESSSAVEAARSQRRSLRAAMGELETALSAPSPGRIEGWLVEVESRLGDLQEALESHIVVTEEGEGLFDEIIAHAPRLAHRVDRLRQEHTALRHELTDVRALVCHRPVEDGVVHDVREKGVSLLAHVVRHRHLGADIVYEAFNVDIEGGGD